jgi:hypothetical protein
MNVTFFTREAGREFGSKGHQVRAFLRRFRRFRERAHFHDADDCRSCTESYPKNPGTF